MAYRPMIGITMRLDYGTRRFYSARDYSEALAASGATPVYIPLIPETEYITNVVAGLDGILLTGSDSDIDPVNYEEEPHLKLGDVTPERDQTDLLVLAEAERLNLPVFAICFGMQSLNVSRGGSLIQDIESQVENAIKHQQGIPRERHSHQISIAANSLIEKALTVGPETVKVNSHHHQAIKLVGKDLEAIAWANDGVIEAVQDTRKGCFVLGVQWHPELAWETDELSKALFADFIKHAGNRKCEAVN